jgi:tRNA (guanine-N7-)-methyltransferase
LYLCNLDAVEVMANVSKNNLKFDEIFVLYPDPWPKAKHHKRRIFSQQNLPLFHSVLNTNCNLTFVTDHESYKTFAMEAILSNAASPKPLFKWAANNCDNFNNPPSWWVSTKFEQKAIKEGRKAMYVNLISL